ncbi:hypothetical protein [Siccirubricoccus phaeus]|uniref:hypothetical protein n=1 Tax=Siccirubricoccus phaeus TaxID=2595053 RepID=UPI0011F383F9|nr:hypothetical protein [Siccirubricoccus phaeus]
MSSTSQDPILIGLPDDLKAPRFEPAGDAAAQIALNGQAGEMVEVYDNPYGQRDVRFAARWLKERDWAVILLPRDVLNVSEDIDRIAGAVTGAGVGTMIGLGLDAALPGPFAAWRLKPDGTTLNIFFMAHVAAASLVFAPDRRLAILDDGECLVLAGPAGFVRRAVGEVGAAWHYFETERRAEERFGRPGWLLDVLAHYQPFALAA